MKRKRTEYKEKNYGGISSFIKGLIVSFILTFACIIIFAFIIKLAGLSDSVISPVNLGIKALSVFIGSYIFAKKSNKGLIKGITFAIFYTLLAFVLFSVLAGGFNVSFGLLLDVLFTSAVGGVAGILGVNTKK